MPKMPVMNVGGSSSADTIDNRQPLVGFFHLARLEFVLQRAGAFLEGLQVVHQAIHPGGDALAVGDRVVVEPVRTLVHHVDEHGAQRQGPGTQGLAFRALGSTQMSMGEFAKSIDAFEMCIAVSGQAPAGACFERHGEEPKIVATSYKGWVLCLRGFADSGLECAHSALSQANSINHPLSVTFASAILSHVLLLRRDYLAGEALAKEQIEYCRERGLAFWLASMHIYHGVASAHVSGNGNGIVEAENGILDWTKTGAMLHVPTWSSNIAEAALVVGDIASAEKALSKGLEISRTNGEEFALAELHRLTGRLRAKQDRRNAARDAFAEAVATAQRQGAKLDLLRAARDLARLLAEDGDRTGARKLLQPIVEEFPEHRDGLDFQEAAKLLAELSA
jgi:tetratricopeptide (TPR) repeat protein